METRNILASLCYFSIIFAPFLFPVIVYFVSDDVFVKEHAKKSLLSHLIPIIGILLIALGVIGDFTSWSGVPVFSMIGFFLYGLICFIVFIWNIVKGITVLKV